MADLLAQGYITIAVVNDGYSLSLTTSSVSIPANHDGSDPDLSCAYTNVSLSKGNVSQPIEIINVIPSTNGIQYTYVPAGPYNWKVSIIGLASDITSGYLDIIVRTPDGYQTSARFNFSVVRNTTSLDWIEEWNGTHTQIGSNYVITPKLFAGHKTSEGKITGIYLGKLKGFIGEVFPFTLSDAEEGLYGYRDNKIVFYIDNNGARIGGWDITPDSIQCLDGTLTIKSEGAISSQSDGIEHWALKKDGSASFANGKVTMDAKGNASFDGHIIARSGELAGWTIGEQSIYKVGVAINSSRRFIAAANVITSELEGDQFDWVKQYGGAAMYYISNADYGFIGYKGDKLMFSAGSKNYIAGWSFDESAFWLGTKNNNMGQFTKDASSITIGTNGIRGYKFYLDKNGAGALAGGNIVWDETGKVTFSKDVTLQWSVGIENAQNAALSAANEAQEAAKAAKDAADLAQSNFDSLKGYVDGAFSDGIISSTEAQAIEKYINIVNNTKAGVEATYTKLYANTYLDGTEKTTLLNTKVSLFGAISDLIACINTAISDGKVTTEEKNNVNAKFTAFNSALSAFNTAVETANKKIQDNLKGYSDAALSAANEAQEAAKAAGNKYGQLIGTYLTYIDQKGIYTGTLAADQIISGTISTANIKQANNRWFLNQDGSGSLANGNISWDQAGNVQFSNDVILAWKDVLAVGSYTVSMTTPSVVCATDNDGNNADLSDAYTTISVWSGKTPVKFTVLNVFPSADGIKYSYENAGDYSWKVALTNVAATVQSGFLTIVIKTQDNFEMSVRFSFAMVRNPKELAFLDEWEGSYTQIGSNYVVTPRIFAGMKTSAGKLTGVYLGKLSGYLGQTLPFTLSEAEAGIYGYKDSTIIFSIDNQGALIAGWKFDSESLYLGNKNNTSGQFTNASGSITIGTKGIRGFKWELNSDGSGSLAGGNIKWDAAGNVTFGASVILNWTNAAQEAADAAKDEAIDEAQKAADAAEAAAKELASAMAFGKMLYRDPTFAQGGNGISVYNNSGNGTVTITRTSSSTVPNDSGKMLTIKNTGTASPNCGGFTFSTACGYRKIFITRIIAKIPVGRDITFHTNSMGTGGTQKWLTPTKGTGDWQEYICKVYCGTSNFSSTHFFAITGSYNVTWYLAYATVFDVTTSERYTTTIDANGIYTASLNANQITAGTIDADRIGAKSITADKIAANTITSAQINGDSIKTNIINTSYINGLSCTFTKGTIGGWTIGTNSISKNNISLGSDGTISNGSYWSLKNDGSGFFAKGNITWKTDGTFEAKNGKFTGEIQTTKGTIGGFEIASGRIGVAASSGATSGNSGLSILQNFIKFSNSYCWASIGVNVLPSSTGIVGVGRFTNSTPNSYGTNYGLLINVSGAQQNIGIVSNGAVVCNSYITDYGISKLTPSANTCFVPGDATKPNLFKLLVSFVNDNAGVGLPTRTSVCSVLGISSSTAFAVRITIICDRSSSKTGYVCGRNTFVGNGTMNSNYYPYMLNQNADNQTGKWNMARGDTREFMLVWDGSSNYYAYLLNISE
nr:MAG TPA: Minor structural protein putative tail fiber [Caudoviricetes sp.]